MGSAMTTLPTTGSIYSFGEYELDTRLHELRRDGEPQRIEPQVFDVLAHLFACRDRVVTKEELLDAVWGHRYVAPTTLNSRIKVARQVVGDDGTAQRVIRTVHGLGFRVVTQVEERSGVPTASVAARQLEQRIGFCTASDGVRIAYATSGDGPPLVKAANWLTHVDYDWESPVWRHWMHELSSHRTLVRYDERGSGLSDRDCDDLSFESWVHDLESVVDALGLERFPLLGISQGCAVSIAYAVRHPERVSRLVLYGGFLQGLAARARTPEERAQANLIMTQMPLGWGMENPAFRVFFATRFLPEGTPEQVRWFSELQRVTTSPEIASRLLSVSSNIDVTDLAPLVRVPTLVLHAKDECVVPFDAGRQLATRIPGARLVPLEGRNHVLLESEPAWPRFAEEVRRFLAEDESSDAAPKATRPASAPQRQPARRPR
jgi:pimeloyl-ACP methyl ester carboxylesterase/DNA-binding winged helix-turn-helix (wHTH) protein